jgi:hypothetical protein
MTTKQGKDLTDHNRVTVEFKQGQLVFAVNAEQMEARFFCCNLTAKSSSFTARFP